MEICKVGQKMGVPLEAAIPWCWVFATCKRLGIDITFLVCTTFGGSLKNCICICICICVCVCICLLVL